MISIPLARRLHAAGLHWQPRDGDRFFIPDRGFDDETFAVSRMTIDVRTVAGGAELTFNGAVEWALDAIMKQEVVWLPSEAQLRDLLAERFRALTPVAEGWFRCDADIDGVRRSFEAPTAADAYGLALLAAIGGAA
jgi:hypothetical protein